MTETNYNYDVTCGKCFITFSGKMEKRSEIEIIYRMHEQEIHNFMSGQEFYNRFFKELGNADWSEINEDDTDMIFYHDAKLIDVAARRAAGLES